MTSDRKIAANRANAQHSTGPKSLAGKMKSKRNSLKHGLLSKELLLSWEDGKAFEKLLNALFAEHHPEGATEILLVEQMAISIWKLGRLNGMEAALMERHFEAGMKIGVQAGKEGATLFQHGLSFAIPKNQQLLLNYESQLHRTFNRSLTTLHRLQHLRRDALEGEATFTSTGINTPEA